jgi:hypothetical protein
VEVLNQGENMKNKAHLTAISRKKPSLPMSFLYRMGLLNGSLLDYGCGRGYDAKHFDMDSYDSHYQPKYPTKKYDTITCHYVLNVVPLSTLIINELQALLKKKGICYITVRRDKFKEGYTSRGTFQRNVILNLPILKETKAYCIYVLTKEIPYEKENPCT